MNHSHYNLILQKKSSVFLCCFVIFLSAKVFSQKSYPALSENIENQIEADAENRTKKLSYQVINTSSPRETINTFLRLRKELEDVLASYRKDQTYENSKRIGLLAPQLLQLIDLSLVPKTSQWTVGVDTLADLLDILGRIELPKLENIPDETILEDDKILMKWQLPKTPIKIVRIEDGARAGEYLFSSRTVQVAQSFYRRIEDIPLRSSLDIEDWQTTFSDLHGPFIPVELVAMLPDSLKAHWFDTPIWKNVLVLSLIILAVFLIRMWGKLLKTSLLQSKIPKRLRHFLMAGAIIIAFLIVKYITYYEINVAGSFSQGFDVANFIVMNLSLVWIFWLLILSAFDWIILSPKIPDESLDADLLRLLARIIGFIGCVLIISYGANDLGLPVVGLFAGLGVGGLAVALAIRPTLENLIGGFILFLDRPVRIGDFCGFGSRKGTIENIGLRSTQIRAWDRTLITIPNATFANMEITNWAQCDQMLILSTIGLRYETEVDQLRFVLARMREMFLAHPSIDNDTVRVRFIGYGSSSLEIEIRVYALAREWNGFYAIREDVLFRVKEIIEQSGTSFAFPSQTLYMGKDNGLDEKLGEEAVKQVKSWRKSGKLPFPSFSASQMDDLKGTLDYPPKGSIDSNSTEVPIEEEPLSAEPLSEEPEAEDQQIESTDDKQNVKQ